jgi:hypothetical protein
MGQQLKARVKRKRRARREKAKKVVIKAKVASLKKRKAKS